MGDLFFPGYNGVTIARGLENAPWRHRSFGIGHPDGFRLWYYQDLNS